MRNVYVDDYLSRRFDLKRYNCWHLVREVWADMTGTDLGDLTPASRLAGALRDAADDAADGPGFQRLERAESPCIVLLRRRRDMPHVGALIRGRLLHITCQGVRYQDIADVADQFETVEFYVPRSSAPEAA